MKPSSPHFSPPDSSLKGISLIEVMAVLMVLAIISGIGSIGLTSFWEKQQLEISTSDLKNHLQVFRMKAIIEKSSYQLALNQAQAQFRRKQVDGWTKWKKVNLNSTVQVSHSGSITFSEKGFASPKTINLQNGEYRKKLIININGRIRESQIY